MPGPSPRTAGLAAHAAKSKEEVIRRLREAMRDIESEIAAAGGIYPHNGGKLTQKELCVRAKVEQPTLQKPTHKTTTLVEVNGWLARAAAGMRTRKQVKKTISSAMELLRSRNRELMQAMHEHELELIEARSEASTLRLRVTELENHIQTIVSRDGERVASMAAARRRRERAAIEGDNS